MLFSHASVFLIGTLFRSVYDCLNSLPKERINKDFFLNHEALKYWPIVEDKIKNNCYLTSTSRFYYTYNIHTIGKKIIQSPDKSSE